MKPISTSNMMNGSGEMGTGLAPSTHLQASAQQPQPGAALMGNYQNHQQFMMNIQQNMQNIQNLQQKQLEANIYKIKSTQNIRLDDDIARERGQYQLQGSTLANQQVAAAISVQQQQNAELLQMKQQQQQFLQSSNQKTQNNFYSGQKNGAPQANFRN